MQFIRTRSLQSISNKILIIKFIMQQPPPPPPPPSYQPPKFGFNIKNFRNYKCSKTVQIRLPNYKEEVKPPIKIFLRQFNYGSHSVEDLNAIDWESIVAITLSESGSQGVFFIETKSGTITLKYSGSVGVDIFLNKLADKIGLTVPKMKYLQWKQQEMEDMINHIKEATLCDDVLHYRIKNKFKVAFFELIQYIPNLTMSSLGPKRAPLVFQTKDDVGKLRMTKIGLVYAFDLFLNNGDRYPLNIWQNNGGNIDNLLLKVECHENNLTSEKLKSHDYVDLKYDLFYAIDHTMTLKTQSNASVQDKLISKYKQDVKELLLAVMLDLQNFLQNNDEPNSGVFDQLAILIFNYTLHNISKVDIAFVMLGVCVGIQNLVQLGIEEIVKIKDETLIDENSDWEGNFNESLKRFNVEFQNEMLLMFSQVVSEFEGCVKKARKVYNNLLESRNFI